MAVQKIGDQFLVNTATANNQDDSAITRLANGDFVVVWTDVSGAATGQGGDTSAQAVKAQRFDATGVKLGGEILVNTTTTGAQDLPTVASLTGGGFVVGWTDASGQGGDTNGLAVRAQRFDASGTKAGGELLVNTETAAGQSDPTITGLANGGFAVSWTDESGVGGDTSGSGVKAQLFNATGTKVGGEFLVNTEKTNIQLDAAATTLVNGNFVVSWLDLSGQGDTFEYGVKAQIFDPSGTKVGDEFQVNTATEGSQGIQAITALPNGGFVAAWMDNSGSTTGEGDDTDAFGIKAQVFSANGAKVGDEFLVNTATASTQQQPTIAALADSSFVVSWADLSGAFAGVGDDIDDFGVKAQLFDSGGTKVGEEFLVNTATASQQLDPAIAALANGKFVVSWTDNSGPATGEGGDTGPGSAVRAQLFSVTGLNEAPTAVLLSDPSATLAENNSTDVKVSDIAVTDDGQGINVLSLSGTDAGSFEIRTDGTTGAEELWFTGAADYETKTSYEVTVDVDDSSVGSSPDASSGFTLDITDVNEFAVTTPTDSDSTADAIAENATGAVRITASASDADGTTNGVSYSLVGAGGATGLTIGNFTINPGTGVVTLTTAYDREALDATGNVSVTVRASSADGSTADQSFAVAIGNVVENQTCTLTAGPDTFVAVSDDNWTVDGLAGNDSITTLAGADTVRGNGGDDVIVTGAGNDSITFSGTAGGFDDVDGGDDTDTVRALASGTIIGLRRLANVEAVTAAGFANVIIASSALADILDFTGVTLTGIGRIDAGAGDDQITGSAASDVIVGALGDDILVGGGNDSFQVGLSAGVDSYDGGSGTDAITATAKNAVIGISSLSGIEQISNGNATNVSIAGSLLADVLDFSGTTLTQISRIDAGGGSDQVTGSTADDIILGGADDDVLAGGPGRDTLTGGPGADTLTGGAAADKFAYANPSDSGLGALSDLVVDFSRAQSDRIDLSAIDANLNVKNDQKFSFIGSAAFSNKAGELRAEIVAGDTHIFGDVDGVNGADFEIRLDVATTLQAQDFVL